MDNNTAFTAGEFVRRRDNGARARVMGVKEGMIEVYYFADNRSRLWLPAADFRRLSQSPHGSKTE